MHFLRLKNCQIFLSKLFDPKGLIRCWKEGKCCFGTLGCAKYPKKIKRLTGRDAAKTLC